MIKVRIPPMAKGRIKAVRGLIGGLASATKAARKAMEKAEERHGPFSDEYAEASARYEEANDLLKRLCRLLKVRLDELEQPYRR